MQKLKLAGFLLLASAAVATSAAAGPSTRQHERPSTSGASLRSTKPEVLTKLLAAAETGGLSAELAASLLLAAGPSEAAAAFHWIEESRGNDALLPPLQRGKLQPALAGSPAVIVRIAQLPQVSAVDRQHAFRVGLEAIVGVGGKACVQDMTTLLTAAGAAPGASTLRSHVTSAVARLAQQPKVGSTEAAAWLTAAGPNLSPYVVDGMSEAKAVTTLVGCLPHPTGAEGAILNRVAGLIQKGEPVATESTVAATLPFIASNNSFERAEASTILGFVGDRRHVKQLITALDDSEPMVRTNSLKALKNLTGMTISGDVSRWQKWRETQEAWWEHQGEDLVGSLASASRLELVSILKQVSTQRLYRREITEQLLPMLDSSQTDEVQVAVASLATLRNPAALPAILELREHHDPKVRATVEDALVAFRHSGIHVSRVKVVSGR